MFSVKLLKNFVLSITYGVGLSWIGGIQTFGTAGQQNQQDRISSIAQLPAYAFSVPKARPKARRNPDQTYTTAKALFPSKEHQPVPPSSNTDLQSVKDFHIRSGKQQNMTGELGRGRKKSIQEIRDRSLAELDTIIKQTSPQSSRDRKNSTLKKAASMNIGVSPKRRNDHDENINEYTDSFSLSNFSDLFDESGSLSEQMTEILYLPFKHRSKNLKTLNNRNDSPNHNRIKTKLFFQTIL